MATLDDLKGIVLLSHLTEEMKAKLLAHMELRKYKQDEFVFREGEPAANFFFLRTGKVVLEKRLSDKMTVTFGSVKPGYSFGWSAMLRQPYTTEAICSEPAEILVLDADKTHEIMEADNALGFIFSQRLLQVIKKRLEVRTEQFVKAIANNPECMVLLE